ncbi:SDR family NAD(P)-dependent oxidoreductase [Bacillus sp. BRMEA1]|nr:SDR family NAD(P)-dependent oxidoreductase [Neobacillus endophyticus]
MFITGANGYTGRHAIRHFLQKGMAVTAVVRSNFPDMKDSNLHIVKCDVTNETEVNSLIQQIKPDYILHLAGKSSVEESWKSPADNFRTNVMSTLNLLEAVRMYCPSAKIIVVGSALQFNPQAAPVAVHPYSLSKGLQMLVAESWKRLYGLNIVLAKPSNIIGPGFSNGICSLVARKIAAMEEGHVQPILEVNDLSARRDFIDVRDVVRAYDQLLFMDTNEEVYEICTGISRPLEEVMKTYQSMTDIKMTIKEQKSQQPQFSPMMDPSGMKKLNWEPAISFENSLHDTLQFFRGEKEV